jgi:glyoxylase-like metal-dependent hydrolase (beta-lactamase superfamily II)
MCYYLREEQALFSGDHIMGWSTTVLTYPDGDLNSYMASLERLRSMNINVMYPAHGAPILETRERIDELIAHRRMRTEQIVQAIQSGFDSIPEIVVHVYSDADARLHPVAQFSVLAHVDALLGAGLITVKEHLDDPLRSRYGLNQ